MTFTHHTTTTTTTTTKPDTTTSSIKSKRIVNIDRPNGKHIEVAYEEHSSQLIFRFWESGSHEDIMVGEHQFGMSLDEWVEIEAMLGIGA